jgi:NAD kinase
MKFKTIILVYKENLHKHLFEKIDEIKKNFPESNFLIIDYYSIKKELLKDADLILTVGGDGTFVKAAHLSEDSLILGINSNPKTSEGALTSITIDEIGQLKNLDIEKFEVIERQRADVILNNKLLDEKAVNEVYIGTASQFHNSRYKIKFKNKEEEQRSSGIIVSTGTGSEAWFLSAGGKPFNYSDRKLKFIIREPYTGKRIFVPALLNGEIFEGEKLNIESTREFGGIIAINDSVYDFNAGDIVEIKLSDKPLRVIKLK